MGDLLTDCRAVTGQQVDALWVDEEFAVSAQRDNPVRNWGVFPVWHPQRGPDAAGAQFAAARARAAGLVNRPVRETARDILDWWQTLPEERTTTLKAGLQPEYEAALIARWKDSNP